MNYRDSIETERGEKNEAIAPVIVSASRSTDIPAFYADWFMNRLNKGYVVWINPFTQQPMYISFKNTKVIVFWTKNPKPLVRHLHKLDELGIHYYFQFTLNDYVAEGFEPNVPSVEQRVETFRQLSNMLGKERLIWRFDPLIVTPQLTPRDLLVKIWNVGNKLKGLTDKLVFSFVDINAYYKVQNKLTHETNQFSRDTIEQAEFTQQQMNEIAAGLAKCRDRWAQEGWDLQLATCGEKIDLGRYGIAHNRCIDGELMKYLWPEDKELLYYLYFGEWPDPLTGLGMFGLDYVQPTMDPKKWKDNGQRRDCGCMISKDIGQYNTCPHQCVYCFANTSKAVVMKNWNKHLENPLAETISGL